MSATKVCHNCLLPKGKYFRKEKELWCSIHGGFMLEKFVPIDASRLGKTPRTV